MSAELALVTGLAVTAFLALKISDEFREADSMIEEAVNILSIFFLIGLMYTGHGIATDQSLSNAQDAYLVGLMLTVFVFLGLLIQLVQRYRKENRETTLGGFSLGENR